MAGTSVSPRSGARVKGRLAMLLEKLGPHGGARCIPVEEYLTARVQGRTEVERQFFSGLLLRNGVYRTTSAHRMDDLFPRILARAQDLERPLRVLDVACSAGIATVELHRFLAAAGVECETWGSDLLLRAPYARRQDGVGVLFDRDQQVLQIDMGGWATPWRWRPRDLAFRPVQSLRARRLMRDEIGSFRSALRGGVAGYRVSTVPLLALEAEGEPNIRFVEEDILSPAIEGRFSLIRVANLLNEDYFTRERIRLMAAALCDRLVEGGLLLVVRTLYAPAVNRATFFRRVKDGLAVVEHVNEGNEAAESIAGCGPGRPQ
jgi:chemotaxis methyl-accepting protein methylase